MERQNITLSLPTALLKKARHLAVERGTSLSGLLSEFLSQTVDEADRQDRARARLKKRIRAGFDMGTEGKAGWTREALHER
jgi:hypothetical protein